MVGQSLFFVCVVYTCKQAVNLQAPILKAEHIAVDDYVTVTLPLSWLHSKV